MYLHTDRCMYATDRTPNLTLKVEVNALTFASVQKGLKPVASPFATARIRLAVLLADLHSMCKICILYIIFAFYL
jgi:hypothetical protein